jgi:hypothetical protein
MISCDCALNGYTSTMNFEPPKFFIGQMDFFSILLPGALLTYLLMDEVGPVALGNRYATLAGAQAWAAFLFASYLFGHLVFLLGSWLDEFYDWARRHALKPQIAPLRGAVAALEPPGAKRQPESMVAALVRRTS